MRAWLPSMQVRLGMTSFRLRRRGCWRMLPAHCDTSLRMRTAANRDHLDPTIRWLSKQLCGHSNFASDLLPLEKQPIDQLYDLTRIQQASLVVGCGELVMPSGAHVFGPYYLRHGSINSSYKPLPDPK